MSANNMSDEELDRLFRKSAGQYDPPFDEEAWKAMERKLNGEQSGWAGIKRSLPLVLLALLVTVGLVWKLMDREAPLRENVVIPAEQGRREAPAVTAIPDHTKPAVHTPLPEPASPAAAPYPAVQPGSEARLAQKTERGRSAIPARTAIPRAAIPANRAATVEEPLQTVATVLPETRHVAPESVAGIARQVAVLPLPVHAPLPADSSQSGEQRERMFLRHITVTLVAAPDITTVLFKDPDAVSANAGVLLSVPITNRLRLVSGAVWANKLYKATPENYKPSPDYWDGKRQPDVIAAQCKVLDIPVNLQYQVLGWGRNMLTVQSGLSSYLMLNEEYTYTYYYPAREPYRKTQEFSNENRHWFGIQNLSVGYTRQLSPAITIGAEPFVKIPLASIGEGRVKLTSAGVFFTAGFTLR
ncbi:hypothetical protein Q4E40_09655 [Pontibacter sp. BT731]|uniref:hypothetical protein n=1 Tax=Pontibacter coccineus TaxID=3063328 RepID=UPI0026E1FC7C|nr:hypothetical protein [Pontibacter sp. BT731]MDO6390391.1 hypothetical protein [Pontibacter sp. BT731]